MNTKYIITLGILCNTKKEAKTLYDRIEYLLPHIRGLTDNIDPFGLSHKNVWVEAFMTEDPRNEVATIANEAIAAGLIFNATVEVVKMVTEYVNNREPIHYSDPRYPVI